MRLEPCRHSYGAVVEGRISDLFELLVVDVQRNVSALWVDTRMPLEDCNEGGGARGYLIGRRQHGTVDSRGQAGSADRAGAL